MAKDSPPDPLSMEAAEEVLRRIFGDDLAGCPVTLDEIARVIHQGIGQGTDQQKELIEMYEKAIEAVNLLSTPPGPAEVSNPEQLRSLLGDRLDAILKLTQKVMSTTALLRQTSESQDTGK